MTSLEGDARRQAIEEHLPLVESVARRFARRAGEPFEDLVQVGSIGLIKAVDRFDADRHVPLAALAVPAIEGEIRHHLRDHGALVRPPRAVQEMDARVRAAEGDLAAAGRVARTTSELADAVDASPAAVAEVLASRARAVPGSLEEVADPGAQDDGADARLLLSRGWAVLDARERRILELRFHRDLTQAQIAREVGLSQAHVSRLIKGALERLRAALDDEGPPPLDGPETGPAVDHRPRYSGRLLVRMPHTLHADLARVAEQEGVSVNAFVNGALASAVARRERGDRATEPAEPARRGVRWTSVALVANLVLVALVAAVAVVLLVQAWQGG